MIEPTRIPTGDDRLRDERSMRVMEYAMAFTAIVVAILISLQ